MEEVLKDKTKAHLDVSSVLCSILDDAWRRLQTFDVSTFNFRYHILKSLNN